MRKNLLVCQGIAFTILIFLLLITNLKAQQHAVPTSNVDVKAPAYTGNIHPKILFDEAHHNFHKSGGRYKAFADVLENDGYIIIPNEQKITPQVLSGYDVFVCSNAFNSEPDSTGRLPTLLAFTADECQYLKRWVLNGGAVWLIADHEPA